MDTDSGEAIGRAIGQRLRSYYDHIIGQPVPDRFVELLKKLEETEAAKKGPERGAGKKPQ